MLDSIAKTPNAPAGPGIPARDKAVRLALWYAFLGIGWMVCANGVLRHLLRNQAGEILLEDVLDCGFVLASAFLLGLLLTRNFRCAQRSIQCLQDSESKLRLVGDNLPEGYVYQYTRDESGRPRFNYISAGVERVHGVSVAEVLRDATCLLAQIDPAQMPAFIAAEERSARTLADFEMEVQWRHPQGESRRLLVRSRPRRDDHGRIHWDGFAQDITARKHSEEALRQSEELLREMGRTAKVGGWDLDPLTGEGRWTEEVARIHDLDPAVPTNRIIGLSFYRGDSRARIEAALERAIAQAMPYDLELEIVSAKGTHKWVRTIGKPVVENGKVVKVQGSFQDITERKQAELDLQASETKWRSYIENAPVGVLVADAEGRHVEANRCVEQMLGYEAGGLLQTHISDLPARENGEALQIHLQEIARQGHSSGQFRVRRKDGSLIWALVCATRLPGGRLLGIMQDISELKRAEEAVRESEADFRAMFEVASIGVAQADPRTGRWVRVNNKMCAITGYSAEEMLRMKVPEITHPEDRDRDWEFFQRIVRGEAPDYHLDKRYLRKDGAVAWVSVNVAVIRDGAGQAVRTMATIEDITERKRTEERLRLQSAALEAAANAIVITDHTGTVEWVNRAFTALTGYTAAEAVGQNQRLLKSGSQDPAFYRNLWQTILAGRVWRSEMINRHKDGHLYTEEATITPVRDEQDAIRHFIAVKQDITERKRAELELEQTHNQLLALSRQAAIAEFATGILHNVGNVLNSVGVASSCLAQSLKKSNSARLSQVVGLMRQHEADLGSFFANDPKGQLVPGYLAQLADKLAAEQAAALQEIAQLQTSVEHIKAIVTVQQDSAKGSTNVEPLLLTDLVEDALRMHANALARSEIQVVKDFAELPPARLQKHKVLQILVNLIRNAIQACEASGTDPKELKIRLTRSADRLQCAIADSGIGIASEHLPQLFTFGFTTKREGHGFGLHGASLAAREMGGSLSAKSEGPRRGATFTLELPLQPSGAPSSPT